MMDVYKIKCDIIYQHLAKLRLEDPELDRALSLLEIKKNHPSLYNILEHFDSEEIKYKLDLDRIRRNLDDSIINELVEFYKFKTNQHVDETSKWSILHLIPQEMDKFTEQCKEVEKIDKEIDLIEEKILKVGKEYLSLVKKNVKEFKINFKIPYDKSCSNLLCAKAQSHVLKKRFDETENLMKKYSSKEVIQKLEEERKMLEDENASLTKELELTKNRLKKYDSLDSNLMKEYLQLKGELDCRRWALRYGDKSSSSTSSFTE